MKNITLDTCKNFKHVLFLLLFVAIQNCVFSQNFIPVAVTGVSSGSGSTNALFNVSSPTLASLSFIRAEVIGGSQSGSFTQNADNIRYTSITTPLAPGIPDNLSRIRFTFLQADGVTPVQLNDFRFVINDIDGPNNEGLTTDCSSNVRFTATDIPTNLIIDDTPPDLSAIGSQPESNGALSRVMYEFNDIAVVEFDNFANNGFLKDFDLNDNNFAITEPLHSVCLDDSDGDTITDDIDLDDDNDGILDSVEAGGNDPNGDNDGDGLPNFLDTEDNTGQNPTYTANADGSTTDYIDADGDGVPDVYEASSDDDSIPNHLDPDSDNDGCPDADEVYGPGTDADGNGQFGSGIAPTNTNGLVSAAGGTLTTYNTLPSDQDGDGTDDYLQNSFALLGITLQPSNNLDAPSGSLQEFSVTPSVSGSGTPIDLQWQENSGSGFVDLVNGGIYSGVTTETLTITGVSSVQSGNQYRAILTTPSYICDSDFTSNTAVLTVISDDTVGGGTTGAVTITPNSVPGDDLAISVSDADLNTDALVAETIDVEVVNAVTGENETITLTETGVDTGIFEGTVATTFGTAAGTDDDGTFNTQSGDTVTVTYVDDLTATGGTATLTADDAVSGGTTGTVTITETAGSDDVLEVMVVDGDLNTNPSEVENVDVELINVNTGEVEIITLIETGPDTGVFTGTVTTTSASGPGTNNNGTFNAEPGATITVTYIDDFTETGGTNNPTDSSAIIGCPRLLDTDGDGLTDCEETTGIDDPRTPLDPTTFSGGPVSDPNSPCSPIGINSIDSDGDGLTDCEETTGIDDPSTPADPTTFTGGRLSDPNNSCSPVRPGCEASLNVTKIANVIRRGTGDIIGVGDTIEYTIEVENTGDFDVIDVAVEDIFVDANGDPLELTSSLIFNTSSEGSLEGTLLVGEIATYIASFDVTQEAINAGGVSNTAIAVADSPDLGTTIIDTSDDGDDFDGNTTDDPTETTFGCLIVINEFSPNGDGETLQINCIENFPNNKLEVYNRWGNIVFEQRGYTNVNGWDGTSNGRAVINKGEQLPEGTYYYILDLADGSKPRVGWIYINR